jgi:hypothetical protein
VADQLVLDIGEPASDWLCSHCSRSSSPMKPPWSGRLILCARCLPFKDEIDRAADDYSERYRAWAAEYRAAAGHVAVTTGRVSTDRPTETNRTGPEVRGGD